MSVWDRLRVAIGRLLGERPPEPEEPAPTLHWRPDPQVAAVACGAEGYVRWTAESAATDCPTCKRRAGLMILQRGVNDR